MPKSKRKLPPGWVRISRPEKERHPERERTMHAKLHSYVSCDARDAWPGGRIGSTTPLSLVEQNLDFPISAYVRKKISNKKYSKKRPFVVFSLGCGRAQGLKDLKDTMYAGERAKVRTVGFTLMKALDERYDSVDELVTGRMIKVDPPRKYKRADFIFSHLGATFYENLKVTSVERVIHWLKDGGQAVIELGRHRELNEDPQIMFEIKTLLAQEGIKDYDIKEVNGVSVLKFKKPIPKLP